jgi:hypothetical protein
MKAELPEWQPEVGNRQTPGVWKLNPPALLTGVVEVSASADTRSEPSHGKVENGERRIRQHGRLMFRQS